jgi:hypothetical protein
LELAAAQRAEAREAETEQGDYARFRLWHNSV